MTPTERLALLSERNRPRPPEMHNMDTWKCGSTCCVVGFATLAVPEFQAEGFRLKGTMPEYGKDVNWDAVETYFGLDWYDATRLFDGDRYSYNPTPAEVSDRIDEYLKENAECAAS